MVGGALDFALLGAVFTIQGYLVVAAVALCGPDQRHLDDPRAAHDQGHRVQEPGRVGAEICRRPVHERATARLSLADMGAMPIAYLVRKDLESVESRSRGQPSA